MNDTPPSPATSVESRLHDRVRAAGEGMALRLAQHSLAQGLAITRADGSCRAIPVGALPVIVEAEQLARRLECTQALLAATARVAAWRLRDGDRDDCLAALNAAERRLLQASEGMPARLAVARVDYLPGTQLQALEVNATIPAMQAYSDIAARTWLRVYAADHPRLDALIHANGSNSDALLAALQALHAQVRGQPAGRIGLLCRRGDAQLSELQWLCERFRTQGVEAVIVHPDQLDARGSLLLHAGRPLPLLYRHLFLSRLQDTPCAALEQAIAAADSAQTLVLNPPAPHLEMKSSLAWLSRVLDEPALADAIGLEQVHLRWAREVLPWTRLLDAGNLEQAIACPEQYVLKRSWSYGGSDVFVGRARGEAGFWSRVQDSFPGCADWPDLCRRAMADRRGGGFVLQRAVATTRQMQWLCTPEQVQAREVTTDFSAYASLGADAPWSGVCRAAPGDVVNIVGGGGVVPLLRREVAEDVLAWVNRGAG